MKKIYIFILIFTLNHCFCDNVVENPGALLNGQDVPVFYNENPLEGLNVFMVIPPLLTDNPEIEKHLKTVVEMELKSFGEVIYLKDLDTRGLGAGNILNIQIKNVTDWEGKEIPTARISLQIQTHIISSKTNLKSFPSIWAINEFLQGRIDKKLEGQMVKATQTIIKEFIQNYKYANKKQINKPIFYIYDLDAKK